VAFDRDGRTQACMGIAAGDADGDGLLDLYVTNYYDESNTLYRQTSDATFEAASRSAGLHEPSLQWLGFGTQFLDANLDGWPDLVVANGHLDDFRHLDIPFRMPPQFYLNHGQGRFSEANPETVGHYFQRELLGRSVVNVDWNRDGRPDFVVSHLDAPVVLMTNVTRRAGNWLKVRLRAVGGDRDALGTSVTLRVGKRCWTQQLTAGDGFQASNERMLLFGLGDNAGIDRLTVRWTSGSEQEFANLPVNREVLIIESRSTPVVVQEE